MLPCRRLMVALCICLLPTGCGRADAPSQGPAPDKVSIANAPYISFAPLLIAADEGYFAEQNLDVELLDLTRSAYGMPALAQGKIDVLSGTVNAGLLNAVARGSGVRIVADKGRAPTTGPPYTALVLRRDLAEAGVADEPERLRGMRMAAPKDSISGFVVDRALKQVGLGIDELETAYMPSPSRLEALQNERIEASYLAEPWLTRVLQAGHATMWLTDTDVVPGSQYAVVMFGPSLLEERPDVGRRFMVAYLQGVRQYLEGKTERNLQIVGRHTGLDAEILRKMLWPPMRADGNINVQSVLECQMWFLERGLLERELGVAEFWEPAFVQHAAEVLAPQEP